MPPVTAEILIVLALILINGVFSLSEIAVVSARKARLEHMAESGNERARAALQLANEPSQLLSTVQVGITLVGVFAGAFGGATLASALAVPLRNVAVIGPYADPLAFGLVVMGITYLTLIFGELVPKRLALSNPERIAGYVAGPMCTLAGLAGPLVAVLTASTEGVLRLIGVREQQDSPVSEEELRILIEQGRQAGVFNEEEQDVIDRVLRFSDRRAHALMSPRPEIVWLDISTPPERVRTFLLESTHRMFPLCDGNVDNVIGVVTARDLLQAESTDNLAALAQPPVFIPESFLGFRVLEMLRQHRAEMGLVIDEYGGLQGLITLKDLMEAIVGDVPDADEEGEPEIVQRTDGSWLVDGLLPLGELREALGFDTFPPEAEEEVNTVAGLMLLWLQRLPRPGERYEWDDWRFEVVDIDERRIDKVLITRISDSAESEP